MIRMKHTDSDTDGYEMLIDKTAEVHFPKKLPSGWDHQFRCNVINGVFKVSSNIV